MPRRKNGAATIADVRQMLEAANVQLADLCRQRADELRGTADEAALDHLDAEIRNVELAIGRHAERIRLLENAEREAEAERQIREKASLIERIEKRLSERHAAALEIAQGIKMGDAGLQGPVDIARDCQSAWPWQASDLAPCLLAPTSIVAAIQHEGRPSKSEISTFLPLIV
jgi:rubrerythrin